MLGFIEVSKILKNAVPMTRVPDYEIESVGGFNDPHDLHGKIRYQHCDVYPLFVSNVMPSLNCIGCCRIDNYTGNEVLRIFSDIMNSDRYDFETGSYVCFSVDGKLHAAALFLKWNVLGITPSLPITKKEFKYRYMFSKLFDEVEVEKNRQEEYREFYSNEVIQRLRKDAEIFYAKFLKLSTKNSLNLSPGTNEYQPFFTYSFIGLMISIAFKISRRNPISQTNPEYSSIPYTACIKFAFDTYFSGEITNLLGEIGYQEHISIDALRQRRAACALDTSKSLVSKVIPPNEQGLWEEEAVQKIASEVEVFYKMDNY